MTSAPSARVFSTLIFGVVTGTTRTALTPSIRAAYASPWAWLPDDVAMIPLAMASRGSDRALFSAPRILKAPVICSVSGLRYTSHPRVVSIFSARSNGV